MRIQIVAVGKIKEDYLKRGIDDFKTRLSRYADVKILEVAEEDINIRPAQEVKAREAQKLQKLLERLQAPEWYKIVLDRGGAALSSEELANKIESLMVSGRSNLVFVIGGALGLDVSVVKSADFRLSLSEMTFTHQIARFIILEQIYRAFKIIRGESYHY